jgi:hypothetical protein
MTGEATSWLQLGATGVLALICILELHRIRPVLEGVRVVLSALLERERIRSERKREPSGPVPILAEHEDTGVHRIIERQHGRIPTPLTGVSTYRPPSKGTTDR